MFQPQKTTGPRTSRAKAHPGIFVVHYRRRNTTILRTPQPKFPAIITIKSRLLILSFDPAKSGNFASAAPETNICHPACLAAPVPRGGLAYVRIATVRFRTPTGTKSPHARLNNQAGDRI
jgi:hypothetical protein